MSRRIRREAEKLRKADVKRRYLAGARARIDAPGVGERILRLLVDDLSITPEERARSRIQLTLLLLSRLDGEALELLQSNLEDPEVKGRSRRDSRKLLELQESLQQLHELATAVSSGGIERSVASGQLAVALRVHDPARAERLLRDALLEPELPEEWRQHLESELSDLEEGRWQAERQAFRDEIDRPGYF